MATAIRPEIRRITQRGSSIFTCLATVESVTAVSASFVRVALVSEGFAAYDEVWPADAFRLLLPPDGSGSVDLPEWGTDGLPFWPNESRQPLGRAFTVRHVDVGRRRVEFDAMTHVGGLVTTWLGRVEPGDVVGLSGMRREFHAGAGVTRQLIVADSSALPAVAAIVETLPSEVPATVYLGVDDESDRALVPPRDGVELRPVPGGSPTGAGSTLDRAVRDGERPGGRIQAWLAAEATVMRGLRRWLRGELGVAHDDLHSAAYWSAGVDNTALDTVRIGRYQELIASGADATDPDVRDAVELGV